MATGTPAIVSRLGAMAELVTDGHTGFLFEPGNADELKDKVEQLFHNGEALTAMRHAARREYENKYTAQTNYERLMEIYRRALSYPTPEELRPYPAKFTNAMKTYVSKPGLQTLESQRRISHAEYTE